MAGVSKMPYGKFLLFDIPAIIVWAVGITWFGYAFGEHIDFVDKVLSRFGYTMLGLLVAFFLGAVALEALAEGEVGAARPGRAAGLADRVQV